MSVFVKTYHKPYSQNLVCTLQETITSLCDVKCDYITVLKTILRFLKLRRTGF